VFSLKDAVSINSSLIYNQRISKTGKKNKELLSQPFADWGHPNPLIIFRCLSGTAFETFLSSLPNGKKCKINVQTFNSNKQISNMFLNSS